MEDKRSATPTAGEKKRIVIRYLDLEADVVIQSCLLINPIEAKRAALERLGIEVPEGILPASAWLLAMCRENGLEEKLPAVEIGEQIMGSPQALRFMFFLSGR